MDSGRGSCRVVASARGWSRGRQRGDDMRPTTGDRVSEPFFGLGRVVAIEDGGIAWVAFETGPKAPQWVWACQLTLV